MSNKLFVVKRTADLEQPPKMSQQELAEIMARFDEAVKDFNPENRKEGAHGRGPQRCSRTLDLS
jgi:hypothetical protein